MIPLSIAILMLGLVFLQWNYYRMKQQDKVIVSELEFVLDMENLKKEFTDYKKRVDTLTLRAGFKL